MGAGGLSGGGPGAAGRNALRRAGSGREEELPAKSLLRGAASAIDYQVNGTLQVDLPFAKPIPVTHSGQVPLMVP